MQKQKIEATHGMEQHEFDFVCRDLTRMLDRINPDGNTYRSRGQGVGWRNQSGETTVTIEDGRDLIQKLTPDGLWNLEAECDDEALHISLSHHDSPTGETHVLTAAE